MHWVVIAYWCLSRSGSQCNNPHSGIDRASFYASFYFFKAIIPIHRHEQQRIAQDVHTLLAIVLPGIIIDYFSAPTSFVVAVTSIVAASTLLASVFVLDCGFSGLYDAFKVAVNGMESPVLYPLARAETSSCTLTSPSLPLSDKSPYASTAASTVLMIDSCTAKSVICGCAYGGTCPWV